MRITRLHSRLTESKTTGSRCGRCRGCRGSSRGSKTGTISRTAGRAVVDCGRRGCCCTTIDMQRVSNAHEDQNSQGPPRTRFFNQGVQLHAIGDGAVGLGGARTSGVDGCHTERDVARLVPAELGEVRAGEFAVEEAVELRVLGRRLAVRDLEAVRLCRRVPGR